MGVASGCAEDPAPPITTTILICDQDNDLNCVGGDNSEHVTNTGDGSIDHHDNESGSGGAGGAGNGVGPAPIVDCAIEPVGTLCGSKKACNPAGECAPYDWWLLCGTGSDCPQVDCQDAVCVDGACMRWFAEDGTSCFNENGYCASGECKLPSPTP